MASLRCMNGCVHADEHSFISSDEYCFRACKNGPKAHGYCNNVYDEMGCSFNMPSKDESPGTFESCESDNADIVGLYTSIGVVSTFHQSETTMGPAPKPKPPPKESKCSGFDSKRIHGSLKSPYASATLAAAVQYSKSSSSLSSHWWGKNNSSTSLTMSTSLISPIFASSSTSSTSSSSKPTSSKSSTSHVVVTTTSRPTSSSGPSIVLGSGTERVTAVPVTLAIVMSLTMFLYNIIG